MTISELEIETIHKPGKLPIEKYGARAEQLRQLFNIGLPVPNGFFISMNSLTELVTKRNKDISEIFKNLVGLYSLRSSPFDRSWGGIEAILNLGMSDSYVKEIEKEIGSRGALELYRRFIHNFSTVVHGLESEIFENLYYDQMRFLNIEDESLLDEKALSVIIEASKNRYKQEIGIDFPQKIEDQVTSAFNSMSLAWCRPSAKILRKARGAPEDAGLGLVLQEMVLGIGPDFSGSGQINSIDSKSGVRNVHGYFLPNSQGRDSLMGLRTPHMLSESQRIEQGQTALSLEIMYPESFEIINKVLSNTLLKLREFFNFEFTIQNNRFFVLDAVVAERSARASVRVAVDLVEIGAISEEQALLKIEPYNLVEFLHPQISPDFARNIIGTGLPASPGAASGKIVFSSQAARLLSAKGEAAILARIETSPEDIAGMHDSVGVLTGRGGMSSHAAVIARGLGLPCVVGVSNLTMNVLEKTIVTDDGQKFFEGDVVTLDGTLGEVLSGLAKMMQPEISGAFSTLMNWADKYRTIGVRGNADTPQEAELAKKFGADGIGLVRTEHMFFAPERLLVMREMILADTELARRDALKKLLPMQRDDFIKFFQIMKSSPVTIRLLDPPLHEFLPHSEDEMKLIAESMNLPLKAIIERSKELEEFNPMLGKRGVRLGITMPEIYEMQAQAIFEATHYVNFEDNYLIIPEIMIPLVSANREVELVKSRIDQIAKEIQNKTTYKIEYKLGVVVETPRAALTAGDLSHSTDFLSFGTNDLTQMTYGLSRDDAGRFMRDYLEKDVFSKDPFHSLDFKGVGELILIAAERARGVKPRMEFGLCGEHGGDPSSIKFCKEANFDYVSCSPFRIPIARLAAAQASIMLKVE